jgi:hypothetical protein
LQSDYTNSIKLKAGACQEKAHMNKKIQINAITLHLVATSCAASIAAYGDDSSLSALTFIPPER